MNTVRTHMRHLYDKLGAHRRLEAIDRARALAFSPSRNGPEPSLNPFCGMKPAPA